MIKRVNEMQVTQIDNMRGGEGCLYIRHMIDFNKAGNNAKMCAFVTIPSGSSIGEHQHLEETEFYIIINGKALVNDNGEKNEVKKGDIIITPHESTHSIKNTGDDDLELIAFIVRD